jgi:predicted ester cyclase/plastocyanin
MTQGQTTISPRTVAASLSRRGALGRLGAAVLVGVGLKHTGARSVVAQATPGAGASEAVARQALDAVSDAMASGDMSALDAVFAAEVQGHPSHRSLVTGESFSHDLAGLKAALADIRRFFPDAAITIDDLIASGETVAARVRFRGTPDAAVLGLEDGASQQMEIGGLIYGEIVGGRILEFWAYFDLAAYFDLVGVLPAAIVATPEAKAEHGHEAEPILESPRPGAEQVAVTLTEFSVTPDPATLQVGQPYTFVVTNEGAVPHEFVIEQAGAVHDPLVDDEREAMTEPIAPGTSGSLSWTFTEPGAYQLACHEPGHYEAGQVFVIDVTE